MGSFEQYQAAYETNWAALKIRPEREGEAIRAVKKLLMGKARYRNVEARTGVPWWFVGLCHMRESNFNWETYLGNGQSLSRPTTIVPIGRGPFLNFEDGAVDALTFQGFVGLKDWGLARTAYRLEGFNGYGYHSKGVPSPYLYGGSTIYEKGKYTRDHFFDPNFVDTQLGTLVVLKKLMQLDASIKFGASNTTKVVTGAGAVVATGGAGAAAAAAGFSWSSIIPIVIIVAAIGAFIYWRVSRNK